MGCDIVLALSSNGNHATHRLECVSVTLDQQCAAAVWCLISCVCAQVINRIQKLRKHAGLVASEPVEVWLAEGSPGASQGAAATSSGAVSSDDAMGAAAAAPAAAHAANEERAEANGLAADTEAAAVTLSSLLESQVGHCGALHQHLGSLSMKVLPAGE